MVRRRIVLANVRRSGRRRSIDPMPDDDIPERVSALENEVGRMREELTAARTDAEAARVLASGSDHDVSEVRAELRAHLRAIGALREDHVALRQEMHRGFAKIDQNFAQVDQNFAQVDQNFAQVERQFATVHAGIEQIVGLIEGITPE
jgi:septation ring formation regulator EzrA